ncbi:MAG: DUF1801 domain-containing protein [Planctomycetota bacterium]|nr:DUF1801 domain-containing protein [Planctomycetota bacterium]
MQSKAATVKQYLAELPADRRAAIDAVRKVILENLSDGLEEGMQYGMIGYYVPHSVFPQGYHCDPKQPLPYAGIASQKQHMSIYLMSVYGSPDVLRWFQDAYRKSGKKLDMGKACIRFKTLEDLPLDVIGAVIRRVPAQAYISNYLQTLGQPKASSSTPSTSGARAKAPARTPAKKAESRAAATKKSAGAAQRPAAKKKTTKAAKKKSARR